MSSSDVDSGGGAASSSFAPQLSQNLKPGSTARWQFGHVVDPSDMAGKPSPRLQRSPGISGAPRTPENAKKPPQGSGFFEINPGTDLLSHPRWRAVPSALEGLTSGFGMGPGVTPPQ